MKIKQAGFTLIELLVVIVILGILSTIGFANFRSYYGKAFDAERKAAIKAMATMVKVDAAAEIGTDKYDYTTAGDLYTLFQKNDYKLPALQGTDNCYVFAYHERGGSAGADNEFLFATPLEDGSILADGTRDMVDDLTAIDCTATPVLTFATATPARGTITEVVYTGTANNFATPPTTP